MKRTQEGVIDRRVAGLAALSGALVLVLALASLATGNVLDPTFGGDGSVTLKRVRGIANAVNIGPRRGIVGVGSHGFTVVRLHGDGRLDTRFGNGGKRTVRFGRANSHALAVDVRQHGRIVAAGMTCRKGRGCRFAVVRLTRGGDVDKSFGHRGKVTIDFPGDHDIATGVAFKYNEIIVAGQSCNGTGQTDCDIALARLHHSRGRLDGSFGARGKVLTTFEATPPCGACDHGSGARAMAIDSHGRIVVGGESAEGEVGLARFDHAGQLNHFFGTAGKVRADLGFVAGAASIAVDSSDRVEVAGNPVTTNKLGVARFTSQGRLDRSFGSEGVATSPRLREQSPAHSLAIDSRGRTVVAGGSPPPADSGLAANAGARFVRFDGRGRIDRSFGKRGLAAYQHGFDLGGSGSLAIDSRDRVVAAGGKGSDRFAFLRLRR